MEIKLLALLIGVFFGAIGYWFSTFSMQPILRYREIKNQILMDFIYYAQVINAENLNDEMKKLYRERILANRKASAQLSAALLVLPRWYRFYLNWKKLNPSSAASNLIGFSNTTDHDKAYDRENFIRKSLGLPLIT